MWSGHCRQQNKAHSQRPIGAGGCSATPKPLLSFFACKTLCFSGLWRTIGCLETFLKQIKNNAKKMKTQQTKSPESLTHTMTEMNSKHITLRDRRCSGKHTTVYGSVSMKCENVMHTISPSFVAPLQPRRCPRGSPSDGKPQRRTVKPQLPREPGRQKSPWTDFGGRARVSRQGRAPMLKSCKSNNENHVLPATRHSRFPQRANPKE